MSDPGRLVIGIGSSAGQVRLAQRGVVGAVRDVILDRVVDDAAAAHANLGFVRDGDASLQRYARYDVGRLRGVPEQIRRAGMSRRSCSGSIGPSCASAYC